MYFVRTWIKMKQAVNLRYHLINLTNFIINKKKILFPEQKIIILLVLEDF